MHRPRFSLMSLILGTAVVLLSISHWQTSQRNHELIGTVNALREEFGDIIVRDATKAYIRRLSSHGQPVWRYRVYLPPAREYELHLRHGTTGVGEFPPSGISTPISVNGSFNLTVTIVQQGGSFYLGAFSEDGGLNGGRTLIETVVSLPQPFNSVGNQQEASAEGQILLLRHMSKVPEGESGIVVYFEETSEE